MKSSAFSLKKFLYSFKNAFQGFRWLLTTEQNGRVHVIVSISVIVIGLTVGLTPMEWSVIVLTIALVISGELFNTALEKLCDYVQPEHHSLIGRIKDMSAAAVLLLSVAAVIVGVLIFTPYLKEYYQL